MYNIKIRQYTEEILSEETGQCIFVKMMNLPVSWLKYKGLNN